MKIAAFIITYNEESRIKNVIDGLKDFDEVLICDKSSTDRTREIASECGAKILQINYFDNYAFPLSERKKLKEFFDHNIESEWLFLLSASEVVHHGLYQELISVMENEANGYDVIEIPMYKYSMGITGKHSFLGAMRYEKNVFKKELYQVDHTTMIHVSEFHDKPSYRLQSKNPEAAVYHLTHPTLALVMDRHWRYAVEYVEDSAKHGRGREQVMKYAVNECIRLVYRFFKRGIYKSKEDGKAQLMMMIMYNCMIYLNAYFDKNKEDKIKEIYNNLVDKCLNKTHE